MTTASMPARLREMLSSNAVFYIALLGLCSAYLEGGLNKAIDFAGASAEMRQFGLPMPSLLAAIAIVTELCASLLILTGFLRWFGALWLAGFTIFATLIANRFWEIQDASWQMIENGFFEHLGLAGGFLLVAWQDALVRPSKNRANEYRISS